MTSPGDLLRQARESQGLPLDDVARATHIRTDYLSALEQNDFGAMPGDVYTRGFLRNYATFLGINAGEVIAAYEGGGEPVRRRLIGAATPAPPRRPPEPIRIQPLSPTPIDTRVRYAPSFWLMGLLAFVLLIAGYLALNVVNGSTRLAPQPTPTGLAHLAPTAVLSGLPTVMVSSTPVWTPFPTPGPSPIPTRRGAGGLPPATPPGGAPTVAPGTTNANAPATAAPTIDINAPATVVAAPSVSPGSGVTVQVTIGSQNAWVRVDLDGKTNFQGTLPAGSTRVWTGQTVVRVRTGRGDLVSVNVNGADKGLMSDAAQMVVTKEWDAAGNERVIP